MVIEVAVVRGVVEDIVAAVLHLPLLLALRVDGLRMIVTTLVVHLILNNLVPNARKLRCKTSGICDLRRY